MKGEVIRKIEQLARETKPTIRLKPTKVVQPWLARLSLVDRLQAIKLHQQLTRRK